MARMATPVMMEMSRRFMGRPSVRSARCKFCAAATSSSGWRWRAEIEVDALKPGRAQAFIRAKREAMKAAGFSDQQLAALDGIAADIKRQQRFYATKAAGQSNTPQDLLKHLKEHAEKGSHECGPLTNLIAIKEGIEAARGFGIPRGHHSCGRRHRGGQAFLRQGAQRGPQERRRHHPERGDQPGSSRAFAQSYAQDPWTGSQATLAQKGGRQAMYAGLAGERTSALRH